MFFKVKTSEEVLKIIQGFQPLGEETVSPESASGRVLSRDISAPEDLPGFYRSSMDGYAVRARDTFGATESLPAFLDLVGEVRMGEVPASTVGPGQAVKVSTGGMMPAGADGVAMVEYCTLLDGGALEISKAVSPLENVIQSGDDFQQGATVLEKGRRLRPQDVGVLAALGLTGIPVFRRPKVAVISSGDEVVSIDSKPPPGKIRDVNSYTLCGFCRENGAEPILMGICPDDFGKLKDMMAEGLSLADTVWVSGGSSVGTRDLTLKVFESFESMEIMVHGISISPGKPTIIARYGSRAVFGLPGHTVSAVVVAEVFLAPFLARISGLTPGGISLDRRVEAVLCRNLESGGGREEYVRVKLRQEDGRILADPLFGKSGLISTLVEADGLVRVERNTEGLYRGQTVSVMLFDCAKGGRY